MSADRETLLALLAEAGEALKAVLLRDEINTCPHEETYRGGFLWEICHACGAKWADDDGGKPEWVEPAEWKAARKALSRIDDALAAEPEARG